MRVEAEDTGMWAPIYLDFFFQLSFEARPNNFSLTRLEAVRH